MQKRKLVFDPYAGTGSILIAAAARGAHVLGGDIDPRVISLGKVCGAARSSMQAKPPRQQQLDLACLPLQDLQDPPSGALAGSSCMHEAWPS